MKQESKKGIPLNAAFSAVLIVLLIGVLVIVGIVLFQALTTTQLRSVTVTNDALTMTTGAATLTNASNCGYQSATITTVTNSTRVLLNAANYTFTSSTGRIVNTSSSGVATPWYINYTMTDGGSVCAGSSNMITQFGGYIVLVGLVGTIIFLGIIIGVLIASFAAGRPRI